MNWQSLIADLRDRRMTLQEIKDACGFASRGHVYDVAAGKQLGVKWELGDALIRLHKRVMRRKVQP